MKMKATVNNITIDLGFIGQSVTTGEEHRYGEERLTIVSIDLPELTGSEKQVDWATDIRCQKMIKLVEEVEKMGIEKFMKVAKVDSLQEVVETILKNNRKYSWLLTEAKASAVIGKR